MKRILYTIIILMMAGGVVAQMEGWEADYWSCIGDRLSMYEAIYGDRAPNPEDVKKPCMKYYNRRKYYEIEKSANEGLRIAQAHYFYQDENGRYAVSLNGKPPTETCWELKECYPVIDRWCSEKLLDDGWEPFAVHNYGSGGGTMFYFKRPKPCESNEHSKKLFDDLGYQKEK